MNFNGILDDFIILDFINVFKNGMFLKLVNVFIFLLNDDNENNEDEE